MADTTYGGLTCSEVRDLATPFVLGILEPDEAARVREHLATCPEPHPEIAELGSVVPALARSVDAASPSADLGVRILAAARAEQAELIASGAMAPPAAEPVPVAPARGAPRPAEREPRRPGFGFLDIFRAPRVAAAGLVAVLVIAALGVGTLELQGQVASLSAYRDGVTAVLDAAASTGAQVAVLHAPAGGGIADGASGLAAVDPHGKLVVAMRGLPATSGSQVYEAWLIGPNGTPVPAGSFTVRDGGVGTLAGTVGSSDPGVVVALTLEPGPGATTPTLPVLVEGKASAPSS